jgi:hypothetical protein
MTDVWDINDSFYDDSNFYDFDMYHSSMQNYIEETVAKGFVPYFSQYCLLYGAANTEENLRDFNKVIGVDQL